MGRLFTILLRMVVFIISLAILVFLLEDRLLAAFLSNVGINSVILVVFLLGVLLAFVRVLSLRSEFRWLSDFERNLRLGGGYTVGPPSRLLRATGLLLQEKINSGGRLALSGSTSRMLLDGIGLRLEENRDLNRYLVGVLVFLGLLGTFWGLMGTVQGVSAALSALGFDGRDGASGADSILALQSALEQPLSGMATAFSSSLFGLSGSLVVGFLNMQSEQAQNRFYSHVEDWLSSNTGLGTVVESSGGGVSGFTEALLEQMVHHLDHLQRMMSKENEQRKQVSDRLLDVSHRIEHVSEFMLAEQKLLQKLVQTLEELRPNEGGDALGLHAKRIEKQIEQLDQNLQTGKESLVEDMRSELRLLARTISSSMSGGR